MWLYRRILMDHSLLDGLSAASDIWPLVLPDCPTHLCLSSTHIGWAVWEYSWKANDMLLIAHITTFAPSIFFYKVFIRIWDTAGQENHARLRQVAYPGTDVCFIAFNIVDRKSYYNIKDVWMKEHAEYMKTAQVKLFFTNLCPI